ncbi:ATP-binding protein [Marinobacter sp.]|uniref:ATP-binding protein n=1 Tax=Marinobacter sp. TaxID=50741 RepID=UPI000C8EEEF8|nr:ATP-binding protein [Marinobacter sp.]MAB53682.1 hypothetical protein [Marinobacter sp.]|tara:strand:+ start:4348 stop:5124 length:777 start_codon:yes stop_codon:yes gene_type:complete
MDKSTKIEEKEFDKKIIVSGQKFSCDDIDHEIPKPLPQRGGFAMIICGRPGFGKTSLICSLVCRQGKAFNKRFDRVFVFSPSMITMKDDPFELIPEEQKFTECTEENLDDFLEQIKDSSEKVLLILDDTICDVRGKGKARIENKLQKIFFNRRHLCGYGGSCSIMATSQTYNKIDPKLRKTASQLILYKPQKREVENVFDDVIQIPKKEFTDVLRYVFDKKHNFLYIDTTQEDHKMLHKNFNQLIIHSPNIQEDFSMD